MARVLVVDDDRSIRRTLEKFFGGIGHEVSTAADGKEGLDAIRAGSFGWDPNAEKDVIAKHPTVAGIVDMYQKGFPEKLAAVRAMSDADLTKTVDFFGMFQWPNVSYLGFANNHSIHHRGQLASYLRAMGSKVPAIYGGSADEPMASQGA